MSGFIEINQKYRLFFKKQPYGFPRGAIYFIEGIKLNGMLVIRGYGLEPMITDLESIEAVE
jgi:hypothetical protein